MSIKKLKAKNWKNLKTTSLLLILTKVVTIFKTV